MNNASGIEECFNLSDNLLMAFTACWLLSFGTGKASWGTGIKTQSQIPSLSESALFPRLQKTVLMGLGCDPVLSKFCLHHRLVLPAAASSRGRQ